MIARALTLLLALAAPAAAQDWERGLPALHAVTGVAVGDVLNVRAGPSASEPIVFTLAPGATGVEVLQVQGGWGLVAGREGGGWASMRFLAREPGQDDLPWLAPLACSGTEPFWSFHIDRTNDALFQGMEGDADALRLASRTEARGRIGSYGFTATGAFGPASGVIRLESCSDGMSDRPFGYRIDLLMSTPGGTDHVTGCCALSR